jgi:hypothetical protein
MDVTGQLKVKNDTQKVSDKFQKRDFVLATDLSTPYPQFVTFQVTQDKCAVLDGYNVGDEIKVHFNLRGREWNGTDGIKYFNTLEAWRIERVASNNNVGTSAPSSNDNAPKFDRKLSDNDSLPF